MNIFNHFQNLNLTGDQKQALEKIESFMQSDSKVFILKGYAGSGKTTLINGIVEFLKSEKQNFQLMAPTGRAAKVLRDKTKTGFTIHKCIYNFDKLETIKDESEDVAEQSYKYIFPVKTEINTHRLAIVDETSMISDVKTEHELFRFGSGRLLKDLLEFMQLHLAGNKILFVGDPAQLPPVSDRNSLALDEFYFRDKGIKCEGFEMKEVARQAADSLVLKNSMMIRQLLEKDQRSEFILETDGEQCVKIAPQEAHNHYVSNFPLPEVGNGVIISFSNRQCLSYNQMIRERLFPENPQITGGDIVLINNNNYHTYDTELFNGDMAKVIWVSEQTISQTAPVMVDGISKTKKNITLKFRDIKIRLPHFDQDISCKIIDSLLNNNERDLTVHEMKALYINFVMRFEDGQKLRASRGLEKHKQGSSEFKEQLKSDPYFNALRIKYGYAITCHKSQGGEWEKAYVDFYGRVGLSDAHLRWCYTAITRASKNLYAINPPMITSLSKLKFDGIGKIGKIPANALQYKNVPATPYHSNNVHPAKRLKYFEIVEKTESSAYTLERVESREYQEMYFFSHDGSEFRLDNGHNAAGLFREFKAVPPSTEASNLIELLNQPFTQEYLVEYAPGEGFLETLWNSVQSACSELGISITNIDEQIDRYNVTYFFKTSGKVSYIQFYFKSGGRFSTAMPKSDLGADDILLNQLIQKLS